MTNKKGFTLIELVVVIAILGILAGIAVPRFLNATESARGSRIVADLRTIDSALVLYNVKQGAWPKGTDDATFVGTAATCTMAAWPVPPEGAARVVGNANTDVTWTTPAAGAYAITNNQGTLGGATAAQILAGTEPFKK